MTLALCRRAAFGSILAFLVCGLYAANNQLTWDEKEEFLTKAKIIADKDAKKGVTGTHQLTLSDGKITHDAGVQTVDESKQFFLGEVGFKDSYKFNIAAWRLAKLIGIGDMIPPYVQRPYKGTAASFSWWAEDIIMDEADRKAKNLQAPNKEAFDEEYAVVQVFDQLIYNMDRNQTNLLIDKNWHIWMIDHGRAFRVHKTLKDAALLTRIDRGMLAKMKSLDEATCTKEFGKYVSKQEIAGLLARRDLIVKFFDAKGDSALFDRPARN